MSAAVSIHHSPRGSAVTRTAIALAATRGILPDAASYAASRWGMNSVSALTMKAAVGAGGMNPGMWGSALVDWTTASVEFWGLVTEQSVIGRLLGMRRVPLNVRGVTMLSGATANWVGEAQPTPVSGETFSSTPLMTLKVAALIVLSAELAKISDPAAEPLIQADLVRAMAVRIDQSFLDPNNAGAAGVSPASVTFGVTATSVGASPSADVDALIAAFKGDLSRAYWIASPTRFATMAGAAFLDLGARGGEIRGIPAISSLQIGNLLMLVDPSSIAIGINVLQLDSSAEGDVQLSSTPAGGPSTLVSLWQSNMIALRALQGCNWKLLRPGTVEYVQYT